MSVPTETELKAMAYAMKQSTGMKIGHCYEAIAKQHGFKTYAAMRQAINQPTENQHVNDR